MKQHFFTKVVRGIELRSDPARESLFEVVDLHSQLRKFSESSEESQREKLHREFNNEIQSLEIAAQSIAEYPEAPWDLRMQLARQCWDESRHARLCLQRVVEKGGFKGEFPILNQEWGVVCIQDSIEARLAVQNRTFEAGSMEVFRQSIEQWKALGDEKTAEVMETILADEVQHVRYANEWLKKISRENPRTLLKVAQAMDYLKRVNAALSAGSPQHSIENRPGERKEAGFSDQEILRIIREEL
jgi:uncharacterized ferritin-like protein (DUF455 family)